MTAVPVRSLLWPLQHSGNESSLDETGAPRGTPVPQESEEEEDFLSDESEKFWVNIPGDYIFMFDPDFLENENKYKEIKQDEQKMEIIDHTETNLIALRRTIYLTIQSSLEFEECAHKLLKMQLKDEQLRFCQLNKIYMEEYIRAFNEQYETIHRLETNKLRNVAKFFAHLLYTDAIPWTVLDCINRVFIKILFQELAEFMGLPKLNERLKDPDELREHLKNAPKAIMAQQRPGASDSDSDSSDDSSSEESSSSDESSDSSEESSEEYRKERSVH
ncbi:Pre-mRNA-splicing factor CWC22-like protein [Acropora cervicornis]|uniref:Pre-mRNA-splicing factor CWC22-like protein n=1 Tax=Acropora cervicornis TaxID=6130 RepID=A0AAD9Q029_ACRCE|nr:Pre-mRNA-splicing factor CWC22-like protein [Acropora cervicornis]